MDHTLFEHVCFWYMGNSIALHYGIVDLRFALEAYEPVHLHICYEHPEELDEFAQYFDQKVTKFIESLSDNTTGGSSSEGASTGGTSSEDGTPVSEKFAEGGSSEEGNNPNPGKNNSSEDSNLSSEKTLKEDPTLTGESLNPTDLFAEEAPRAGSDVVSDSNICAELVSAECATLIEVTSLAADAAPAPVVDAVTASADLVHANIEGSNPSDEEAGNKHLDNNNAPILDLKGLDVGDKQQIPTTDLSFVIQGQNSSSRDCFLWRYVDHSDTYVPVFMGMFLFIIFVVYMLRDSVVASVLFNRKHARGAGDRLESSKVNKHFSDVRGRIMLLKSGLKNAFK